LIGILVREAGKTFSNAIAEVREAVDFLHYYAGQVRDDFANETHRPLGPVVCISPWNFPLAIFTGQIAAALAAGNSVLAKPAEQTPLIAAQGIAILLEAGVPPGVVQLLPGQGETVGAQLTGDDRVRGVMWDSEIKRAQMDGLEGYPVYTRKVYTDVSYLACAKKLLAVPNLIYPQFATHNAHTLAAIYQLAGQNYYPGQYEFQCLHGMGEPLYEQVTGKVADGKLNRPCRIYAPVGTHETLLAYLVRRLLENGANTSFVNRIADTSLPLDELVADPVTAVEKLAQQEGQTGLPHPKIPLPRDLYGHGRDNSAGLDLANEHRLASLSSALLNSALQKWQALPMLEQPVAAGEMSPVINPAEPKDIVGYVREATPREVELALESAVNNAPIWFATPPAERAAILHRAAVLMESQIQQ
ncbi:proline dehydrogenase family protein, partial [Escherichia coli]